MPVELKCASCAQTFYCHPYEAEIGRKYCSLECRGKHLHKKPNPAYRTPVGFTCVNCSKPFTMMQSYLTAYRKKFGRDPLYCSIACSHEALRKKADERNKFVCAHCGKLEYRTRYSPSFRIYREQKYCSQECKVAAQEQAAHERFQRGEFGRHVKRNGYVWISVPALSNGGKKGSVMEHRYNMSKKLGRELFAEETIHHINGDRADNRIENLELRSSRHGPGQRVIDKIAFAIEMLRLYPEFARAQGVMLINDPHDPTDATPESRSERPSPSCRSDLPTDPGSPPTS